MKTNGDKGGDKGRAVEMAMSQIEKQFGKGSIMRLGAEALTADIPFIPTGSLIPGHCHRHRRYSPRQDHRNLRPRIFRQDHFGLAYHRRGPKKGRNGRLYRCRTCPGYHLRQ